MPISLEIIAITKKKIAKMFLYIVVSYNQNFNEIKKFFLKNWKKTPKAVSTLLYFFWGWKIVFAEILVMAHYYI